MIKQSKKWYISFLFWSSLLLILWIHYLFIQPIRGEVADVTQSVQQAQNYYLKGQFQQAISLLENLLTTSEGIDQATIQCYLAASYRESGQLNKAIKNWKAALEIYRNQNSQALQPQLIAVLSDLGQTYNALGQFRRAIPLLEEAIKLAENNQELKTQAIAWDILGTSHTLSGDYDKAIKAYKTSLNLFEQLNHPDLTTITLNNLSNTFSKRQLKALDEAQAAQLEEDETQANYLLSLAEEDRRSALATATQAVEVSRNLNSLSAVRARLQLMKLNPTIDYRTSVGSILKLLPNSRRQVYELINLAALIDESEAIEILEKGIGIAHQLGDTKLRI
ncbi:lipopolysaccharide assembly protein LapB, partial [Chroococcus sp. FPU101]|uniref:tetratricopeptide repeat protein n=1 Tax=Chroococcus sp. FPU101 TaxID=1974212 RepID=UPI001A8F030F